MAAIPLDYPFDSNGLQVRPIDGVMVVNEKTAHQFAVYVVDYYMYSQDTRWYQKYIQRDLTFKSLKSKAWVRYLIFRATQGSTDHHGYNQFDHYQWTFPLGNVKKTIPFSEHECTYEYLIYENRGETLLKVVENNVIQMLKGLIITQTCDSMDCLDPMDTFEKVFLKNIKSNKERQLLIGHHEQSV